MKNESIKSYIVLFSSKYYSMDAVELLNGTIYESMDEAVHFIGDALFDEDVEKDDICVFRILSLPEFIKKANTQELSGWAKNQYLIYFTIKPDVLDD